MISKCVNKILFGLVAVPILLGISVINSFAQQTAPTGKTIEQASQLVLWYDNDHDFRDRFSFIQVTNADRFSDVCLHFQVFKSYPNDSTITKCEEVDFVDCYSPLDTHAYDMSDNTLELNDGTTESVGADGTKGFVVVTPIAATAANKNADFTAISFQHMFGHSIIFDFEFDDYAYRVNAMGRDAVEFAPGGGIADDFTELDGLSDGFILLQPDVLKFNFASLEEDNQADVVSIAFSDDYAGFQGGYDADPGDATLSVFIFNDDEEDISCGTQAQDCFFDIGINDIFPPANPLVETTVDRRLCPGNQTFIGWARLPVTGLTDFENEMGLVGIVFAGNNDLQVMAPETAQLLEVSTVGGADWMHAE
jgi:hypothetical protein